MLQLYQNTNSGDPKRNAMMDFNPKKVFGCVTLQEETLGQNAGFYARFVSNCLAVELIKIFYNRRLSEAEQFNGIGDELNQHGRYEEALPYFDRALGLSPRFCLVLVNKGIALKNLGRLDEAISCYDTVIEEINPRYKKAWHNKAVALWKKGELEEARTCVDKALEIAPDYPYALDLKRRLE